jgi:hypothetical protein
MKLPVRRLTALVALSIAALPMAQAHPGHDGDHGLVWEFRHLADHPGATLLCGAVLGAAVWGASALLRRRAEAQAQSLRVSARRRGN